MKEYLTKKFKSSNNILELVEKNKNFVIINKSIRNPGIDSVRVLAMFGIIISHLLMHGKAIRKYYMHDKLNLFNSFLFWHINGYCLISGIVGYKSYKYSNLLYLWFCVVFYSVSINLLYKIYKFQAINNVKLYYEFFPIIFNRYWYFTTYFGMYLFLPVINKGIENLSKSDLKRLIISLYSLYIIWHDSLNYNSDIFKMYKGKSILWFIILYITGGYIGKYNIYNNENKNNFFYLITIFIFICSSLLCYYLPRYNVAKININYFKIIIYIKKLYNLRYNGLPLNLQAISIVLFLINIKYNKYIAKIIIFLGRLTFGVYLIHDNKIIRNDVIKHLFDHDDNKLSLYSTLILLLFKSLKIFFLCIIIDYIRNFFFSICKIRQLCKIIEKTLINKII